MCIPAMLIAIIIIIIIIIIIGLQTPETSILQWSCRFQNFTHQVAPLCCIHPFGLDDQYHNLIPPLTINTIYYRLCRYNVVLLLITIIQNFQFALIFYIVNKKKLLLSICQKYGGFYFFNDTDPTKSKLIKNCQNLKLKQFNL